SSYNPRACDCDFCTSHGAAYISDSKGKLSLAIKNEKEVSRFKQGSGLVDFLICRNCGVVVGACYQEGEYFYAAINANSIKGNVDLGESQCASPKQLQDPEKITRWKELWFSNVEFR
ncbi:MAG: aldehyde-activating protein, partial [Sedimenticola sp.]|nr:aldehyde-activating protein [Sedimenticola sp.]